jgi:hypothetical protein
VKCAHVAKMFQKFSFLKETGSYISYANVLPGKYVKITIHFHVWEGTRDESNGFYFG